MLCQYGLRLRRKDTDFPKVYVHPNLAGIDDLELRGHGTEVTGLVVSRVGVRVWVGVVEAPSDIFGCHFAVSVVELDTAPDVEVDPRLVVSDGPIRSKSRQLR